MLLSPALLGPTTVWACVLLTQLTQFLGLTVTYRPVMRAPPYNVASLIPSTRQAWAVLMPSPRSASALSSFTTICSGVFFENFLMVICSAGPKAARTT